MHFKLIQWNCDNFDSRLERLQTLISDTSSDLLCLQETNFNNSHNPYLKNYVNYNFIRTTHSRASGENYNNNL